MHISNWHAVKGRTETVKNIAYPFISSFRLVTERMHRMCACVCSNVVLHWKSTFLTKNAENLQKGLPYLAKEENASRLMEGVGKIPVLSQMALSKTTRVPLKEG